MQGLSGRTIRKLPFLAMVQMHTSAMNMQVSIGEFIERLRVAVETEHRDAVSVRKGHQ